MYMLGSRHGFKRDFIFGHWGRGESIIWNNAHYTVLIYTNRINMNQCVYCTMYIYIQV